MGSALGNGKCVHAIGKTSDLGKSPDIQAPQLAGPGEAVKFALMIRTSQVGEAIIL